MITLTNINNNRKVNLRYGASLSDSVNISDYFSGTGLTYTASLWQNSAFQTTNLFNTSFFSASYTPLQAGLYTYKLTATETATNISSSTIITIDAVIRKRNLLGTSGDDFFTIYGSDAYVVNGNRGNDSYWIKNDLTNNAVISDNWGTNNIFIDNGLIIVSATMNLGTLDLTLRNQNHVIINGASKFNFALGSVASLDIDSFIGAIGGGSFTNNGLGTPSRIQNSAIFAVQTIQNPENGVLYLGTSQKTIILGSSGSDTYFFSKYHTGETIINDASGADIISIAADAGISFEFAQNRYKLILNDSNFKINIRENMTFMVGASSFAYQQFYENFNSATNDAPIFNAASAPLYTGQSLTKITPELLGVSDGDSFDNSVLISITSAVNGNFVNNIGAIINSFTRADLINEKIFFAHASNSEFNPIISLTARDESANANHLLNITINQDYYNLLPDSNVKLRENMSGVFKELRFIRNQSHNFTLNITNNTNFSIADDGKLAVINPIDFETNPETISLTILIRDNTTATSQLRNINVAIEDLPDTIAGGRLKINAIASGDSASFANSNKIEIIRFIGDINSDGYDDFAILDETKNDGRGMVFGFYGNSNTQARNFPNFNNFSATNPDFVIQTRDESASLGANIAAIGDVNGDGRDDFAITALGAEGKPGYAYLIMGKQAPLSAKINIGDENIGAFKIADRFPNRKFGQTIAGLGDINGDGFDDFIIGGAGVANDTNQHARAVVYFGAANLATMTSMTIERSSENGVTDINLSKVGDVNGDGFADFLVNQSNINANTGRSFLIFGGNIFDTNINLNTIENISASRVVRFDGGINGDLIGSYTLDGGFDFNGDGYDDFIIGGASHSYLIYGRNDFSATYQLNNLTANTGLILDVNGEEISAIGDFNKDGFDDLVYYSGANHEIGAVILGKPIQINPTRPDFIGNAQNNIINFDGTSQFIQGGNGIDTLKLMAGVVNLTSISDNKIQSIEVLDANSIATEITIGRLDVLNMVENAVLNNRKLLTINAGNNDIINLIGGNWQQYTIASDSGYNHYSAAGVDVKITNTASVLPTNKAPVFINNTQIISVSENTHDFFFTPLYSQAQSGEVFTFSLTGASASLFDVNKDTGQIKFHQNFDYESSMPHSFVLGLTLYDGGLTAQMAISLTITDQKDLINLQELTPNTAQTSNFSLTNLTQLVNLGDINGDGFADEAVFANGFYNIFYGNVANANRASFSTGHYSDKANILGYDINGDGINDIIIGDSDHNDGAGKADIILGKVGFISSPIIESTISGTLTRATSFGSKLGDIITPVGDLNGDGINEIMVHSKDANARHVYNFIKGNGILFTTSSDDLALIQSAGDFNGDGKSDILDNINTRFYILYGNENIATIYPSTYSAYSKLEFISSAQSIANVAGLGDINGDGLGDIALNHGGGFVNIYYGNPHDFSTTTTFGLITEFQGYSLNTKAGYQIKAMKNLGDVNGDGLNDFALLATQGASASLLHVVYGVNGGFHGNEDLMAMDEKFGRTYVLNESFLSATNDILSAGDANGDGINDIFITDLLHSQTKYIFGAISDPTITKGTNGNDNLQVAASITAIYGGAGDDVFILQSSNTHVVGGAGIDVIKFASSVLGVDYYADTIELLSGTAGNDILHADGLHNSLTGGAGNDDFVIMRNGKGTKQFTHITDFNIATDRLVFDNRSDTNSNQLKTHFNADKAIYTLNDGDLTIQFQDAQNKIFNEIFIDNFSATGNFITEQIFSATLGSHLIFG